MNFLLIFHSFSFQFKAIVNMHLLTDAITAMFMIIIIIFNQKSLLSLEYFVEVFLIIVFLKYLIFLKYFFHNLFSLDLCENLMKLDDVVETVAEFNRNLRTWSSWKTTSLTANGVRSLGNCPNIRDLDLGWCLVNKDPGNCLKFIVDGCPKLNRWVLLH